MKTCFGLIGGVLHPTRTSGFHKLRHTASSIINAQTGNLKLAANVLGHSNISTTANVYTHTTADAERTATVAVERAIFGPVVPENGNGNKDQDPEEGKEAGSAGLAAQIV